MSFVQVPPDSTGKKVDTADTDDGTKRTTVALGDPSTAANLVPIGSDLLLPVKLNQLDFDTGGGSDPQSVVGLVLPGNGGAAAVTALNPLPVGGTLAVSNTAFNSTISNATLAVIGNVADDAASTTTAPVKIGVIAKTPDGTDPGNVSAEEDIATLIADLNRRLFVNNIHPNFQSYHVNSTLAISTVAIASPGAGLQIVLTNVIFSSGTTAAPSLTLKQASTTGTTMFGPIYVENISGRGFASGPIAKAIPASTAVAVVTSAAGDQSVDIDYYIQKV